MTARPLDECDIRFPDDVCVDIPVLRNAFYILDQRSQDPHVLQTLIYFFSCLLQVPNRSLSNDGVSQLWDACRARLHNPYHFIFHDVETSEEVDAVINELDPIVTFRGLALQAAAHLKGNPKHRLQYNGYEFTMVNRGYDWIVRCVYEFDIPPIWKPWLDTMYEQQPYKILDLSGHCIDEGNYIFLNSVAAAAHLDGFDSMVPLIKFWLRQALTIVQVWDFRLTVEGDGQGTLPPYAWCVAAYEKMWHRFRNELRDPFSEYPYMLRQTLLREIKYMRVFEDCWRWVHYITRDLATEDFDPYEVRCAVYQSILTTVQNEYQPRNHSTAQVLKEAFGENDRSEWLQLFAENPVVTIDNLEEDLREQYSLYDGLCDFIYDFPDATPENLDELYSDSDAELYSDEDTVMEYEPAEDVEVEVYGPRIDIAQFTSAKQATADDFCTWCQDEISPHGLNEKCCVVPLTCSDSFHAGCLDAWVNGASKNFDKCPNCKVQMTNRRRARRPIQ